MNKQIDDLTQIPIREFYHGRYFTAEYKSNLITGRVSVDNDGSMFLCYNESNVASGMRAENLFGYEYSWYIRIGDSECIDKVEVGGIKKFKFCDNTRMISYTFPVTKTLGYSILSPQKTMGILDRIHSLLRKEPEKTRYELGLIDEKNHLTADGKDLMLQVVYEHMTPEQQERFNKLVDKLKQDDVNNNKAL